MKPNILYLTNERSGIGKKVVEQLVKQKENIIGTFDTKAGIDMIKSTNPDLVMSIGYRHIIPEDVLDIPELGVINMHKSYLPYNRGAYPVPWSIIDREHPAGVSMHYVDSGIDTGPIIVREMEKIKSEDTAYTLYNRLENKQLKMFEENWPNIRLGIVHSIPQPYKGTYHSKKDFEKLKRIDLEKKVSGEEWINLVKAMTFPPYKNLYFKKNGIKYNLDTNILKEND